MKTEYTSRNGEKFTVKTSDRLFDTKEQHEERMRKYKEAAELAPRTSFKEFHDFVSKYVNG
jgi:hypothetical protein